jgi:ABC-type xylose transport system substrate-binding protein
MAQRQEEDKEKWKKVVANSQLMEDGEGVWFCSFRNVSLGKLSVRTLAVAPSLSYRESPTRNSQEATLF